MPLRRAVLPVLPVVAVVALVAAGCGSSAPSGSPPASPPASTTLSAPSAAQQQKFARAVTDAMAQTNTHGAVVLIRTPQYSWSQAFGTRKIGQHDPVTVADHFRIGSNTKTMTGTVMLQLVQEGKAKLDDPVSKFLSFVPNGQHITLEQLLDMRSGLYNYSEDVSFNRSLDTEPTRVWQPRELADLGLSHPPYFPPGAGFHYSNTNTVLVGMIIEKITGQTLGTTFSQRIFQPLGLKNTSLPAQDDPTIPSPHPDGYVFGTNVSTLDDPALPPDQQAAAKAGTLQPRDVTTASPSWTWAAGGAISTAGDLATYVKALVGSDTLLNKQTQDRRLASIKPTDPANPSAAGYGLALASFGPMIGHDGTMPGFQSFMGYDPKTGNTLIVLTNLATSPAGDETANVIARALMPLLG